MEAEVVNSDLRPFAEPQGGEGANAQILLTSAYENLQTWFFQLTSSPRTGLSGSYVRPSTGVLAS